MASSSATVLWRLPTCPMKLANRVGVRESSCADSGCSAMAGILLDAQDVGLWPFGQRSPMVGARGLEARAAVRRRPESRPEPAQTARPLSGGSAGDDAGATCG